MTTVLVIDDQPTTRAYIRDAAPADWIVLEAPDGLTGVDMVRRHHRDLRLVVLDLHLPDVDGRTVCLRIREIRPDLQVLPVTGYPHMVSPLRELGCLPTLYKPTRPEDLALALRSAISQPVPQVNTTALASLAQEQSQQIERLVRQQRSTLQVVVYAASQLARVGLLQVLRPIAQTYEAAHLPALELLLSHMPWTALVADASAYDEVVVIAQEQHVPIILIAGDAAEAMVADRADVACVLLERDPAIAAHLAAALAALAVGAQPNIAARPIEPGQENRRIVPPRVVQLFADTDLCPRELDVLWLDYQGLSVKQIAQALKIVPVTVDSHWKRLRKKIGGTREEVQAWARERLRGMTGGGDDGKPFVSGE